MFFRDYEMHVTDEDYETGNTREVELKITPPEIDNTVPHYCQPDLEVEIVSIDPPCEITDKIQDDMYEYIKGELVNG